MVKCKNPKKQNVNITNAVESQWHIDMLSSSGVGDPSSNPSTDISEMRKFEFESWLHFKMYNILVYNND